MKQVIISIRFWETEAHVPLTKSNILSKVLFVANAGQFATLKIRKKLTPVNSRKDFLYSSCTVTRDKEKN